MDKNVSLAEVLEHLEHRITHLREQEALHTEQEAFHREQRTVLAAEREELSRRLEAFQAVADLEVPRPPAPPAPPAPPPAPARPEVEDLLRSERIRFAAIVARVVKRKGPSERFGPRAIAAEMKQLFGGDARLHGRLTERNVSSALRYLASRRQIFLVAKGRPHQEAQYVRQRPDPHT